MTSKEALECIVIDLVPKARENNKEEIEQIEKDLEVLEILKKGLLNTEILYDQWLCGTLSLKLNEKEIELVKEWLEK